MMKKQLFFVLLFNISTTTDVRIHSMVLNSKLLVKTLMTKIVWKWFDSDRLLLLKF